MTSTPVDLLRTRRLLELLTPGTPRVRPDPEGQGPNDAELEIVLQAGSSVPDHGALRPWRFIVVSGAARHQLADALGADVASARPDAPPALVEKARGKAFAAPTQIILVASPTAGSNVPGWEQVASAACCGYAIVLAASALGLGAVWKSTPLRDGPALRTLCHLEDGEQILGWINIGSPHPGPVRPKPPVELNTFVTVLPASSKP